MSDRLIRRLRDLVIDRVALVPAGDDPEARIVLWKAKRTKRGPMGPETERKVLAAIGALGERRERTTAATEDVRRRAEALLGSGGTDVEKAATAVATLEAMVEKYVDRHPGRPGHETTGAMGLNAIASTPEGRAAMEAVRAEGAPADKLFRKAFAMPEPEQEPEPIRTGGQERLEQLARTVAKAEGRRRRRRSSGS
ncbi:MAG: hypothetical protein ACRDHU_02355 [Actinomycetota bacterium]